MKCKDHAERNQRQTALDRRASADFTNSTTTGNLIQEERKSSEIQ
jgi:hypothetical protein